MFIVKYYKNNMQNGQSFCFLLIASALFLFQVLNKGLEEDASVMFYFGIIIIVLLFKDFYILHFYFLIIGLNMYLMYVPCRFLGSITVTTVINIYFIGTLLFQLIGNRFFIKSSVSKSVFWFALFVAASVMIYAVNGYINGTGIIRAVWRMSPVFMSMSTILLLKKKEKYRNIFLISIIVAGVLYTAVAYYELIAGKTFFYAQWAGGERYRNGLMRVGSTLGDPNTLAMYIVPTCFLLFTEKVREILGKRLRSIVLAAMLFMLLLSGSRISLAAFIIGYGVWGLLNGKSKMRMWTVIGIALGISVFPFAVSYFYNIDNASSGQRIMLALKAVDIWKNNILFGIGSDRFIVLTYWMTMNEYAKQLVEFGVGGIMVYLSFYVIMISCFIKNRSRLNGINRTNAICILSAVVAFAVNSFSMDSYYHYIMWILPPLCMMFCTNYCEDIFVPLRISECGA